MECIISGWRDWSSLHKWWDFTPQMSPSNFNGFDFQAPQVRVWDLCGGVWWCIFEPNDDKRVDRSGEKSIWVCVKLVLVDANNTLVSSPVPFHARKEKGSGQTCIGPVSPMQRTVCANQMHGSSYMTVWAFCLRFWFMHTRSTWRHTFLGDTGPIHICPDPFSPRAWRGAGDETNNTYTLFTDTKHKVTVKTGLRWRHGALTHTQIGKFISLSAQVTRFVAKYNCNTLFMW